MPPPSPDDATGDDVNSPASEAQPPISTPPAGQVAAGPVAADPVAADPGAGDPGAGKPVAGGSATGDPAAGEHGEPSGPANDQAPAPLPPNAPRPQWVPEPEEPRTDAAWEPSPYPAHNGPAYPNPPVTPYPSANEPSYPSHHAPGPVLNGPYPPPPVAGYGPPLNQHHAAPPAPGYRPEFQNNRSAPTGFSSAQPGDGLESAALLRRARRAPRSGWRRTVHRITGGRVNPGESQQTVYYDDLVRQANAPVRGDFRIAVLSLKDGVGKTTTTVGLGSTFASLRGDRIIAVDANPDLGTLSQRVQVQTPSTVRDLLLDKAIYRYSDVRRHTSQSSSRLEVLASERDPATAETFNEQDYRTVMKTLQRYYNIILTDCGTGLSHSAMNGVLDLAQSLILVSTPALDGARSASATLDWLQTHGYQHLVSRAVVVLSGPRKDSTKIDVDQLAQHFLARTRAVQIIPYDDHLAEGAEVDLELLDKATRRAFVELAATVAEDFALASDEPGLH